MSNNQWDIVDVVSPQQDVTERQANPRGHARSSGASFFSTAALVLSFSFALSVPVVVPLTESTSEVISTVHRAPKQWSRPSAAGTAETRQPSGIDFVRARSGESLARAFDAFFRPPPESESEIAPDGSCFF
jgi:hypothetical protein